eukprot:CAMPEP_0194051396 /NCGR_PEP_ID=MMETSP0009_2-20130614/40248_1 /TAXON_ID=210454 /ORGANISM="Grammatophora oceanica, Strain CCMP 410" /LENGTH=412 /DNA_ID=CAMNT_0038698453 /DNA_START=270 /DNA_END=1508 /DNA_ORIENTATION=-
MAPQPRRRASNSMDDSSSSSSSSSDDSSDNDSMQDSVSNLPAQPTNSTNSTQERAYWLQRTIREAIYGRVLYAVVLERRPIQGDWTVTGTACAIKEMSWQHIRKERDRLAEDPIKEVSAMAYLKQWYSSQKEQTVDSAEASFDAMEDTNIMMPLDLLSDDRHLYSIMPFCDGGELFERLDLNERFSEGEARYWMFQVLNGLENMQRAGICHRDMSLENLLVHKDGCLIIDMGMCLRVPYTNGGTGDALTESFDNLALNGKRNTIPFEKVDNISPINAVRDGRNTPRQMITPQGTCGKWIYMSPEIYKNKDPFDGFAVDIWAAGVILFLMLTGFPPWERACLTDDRFKYMTAGYLVQMLTEWDIGLSSDAMDLLQRMLWLDAKDRLSLEQVRAHPWMANWPMTLPTSNSGAEF